MADATEGGGQNRFLVPQYIETEPKVLGPITIRQFILILVGGMFGFIIWKIFENINQLAALALIVLQSIIWLVFAFATINGQKFHNFVLNLLRTLKKPKLRIWKKEVITSLPKKEEQEAIERIPTKKLPPKSRLADLSLLVDTGGAYNAELGEEVETAQDVEDMNI